MTTFQVTVEHGGKRFHVTKQAESQAAAERAALAQQRGRARVISTKIAHHQAFHR